MKTCHVCIIDDTDVPLIRDLFDVTGALKKSSNIPSEEFTFKLHPGIYRLQASVPIGKRLSPGSSNETVTLGELLTNLTLSGLAASAGYHQLFFLDLIWPRDAEAGNEIFGAEKTTLIKAGADAEELTKRQGLVLACHLLKQANWQGLLCIASSSNAAANRTFLHDHALAGNQRYWICLEQEISNKKAGKEIFKAGINHFLELFGANGLIRWWLSPPENSGFWFDGVYHNPSPNDQHYNAVERRLGASEYWRACNGQYAKRLFYVPFDANEERARLRGEWPVKPDLFECLLGGTLRLDNTIGEGDVCVPVYPALPFLYAVKIAFDRAREESGERDVGSPPYVLKRLDDGRVAFTLHQGKDAGELVRLIKENPIVHEKVGTTESLFRKAIRAHVDVPADMESRPAARFLQGFDEAIATVEWDSGINELRVVWACNAK